MSAELISRINARSQDLQMLPPGFGQLSQQDIAHALGLIRGRGPRLVARVIYAQQDGSAKDLQSILYRHLLQVAIRKHWRNIRQLDRLCEIAIQIYCRPARCQQCEGVGARIWRQRVIVCHGCNGSSWQKYRPAELARQIGVGWDAWGNTWAARLEAAQDILSAWDQQALAGFSKAIRKR